RGPVAPLHGLRAARAAHRSDRGRRLLQAARGRADLRVRPADLHHRGRHPPPDPADRDHAALRQLRGLERGRQLHPPGGSAPSLQPRRGEADVNPRIRNLAVVAIALLSALVIGATYWQAWAVGDLASKQDNAIQRVAEFKIERGAIFASDGTVLA